MARRKTAKKKSPKTGQRKNEQSAVGGDTIRCRVSLVRTEFGADIHIPAKVGKRLERDEERIPVRVVMKGVHFYAQLFPHYEYDRYGENPKLLHYRMYIYRPMAAAVELFWKQTFEITLRYEAHKVSQRGKKVPKRLL